MRSYLSTSPATVLVMAFLSLSFSSYITCIEGRGDQQFILDFVRRVHEKEANALPHEKPTLIRPDNTRNNLSLSSPKNNIKNTNVEGSNVVKEDTTHTEYTNTNKDHRKLAASTSGSATNTACGNVATIEVISGQGEYALYVDGERIGSRTGSMKAKFETIIESHGPSVIAFEATRDNLMNFKENGGLAIKTTLCDKTYGTHTRDWVCTTEKPWTDAWKKWEYNTTSWLPARMVHKEGTYKLTDNLTKEHKNYAIWSNDCSSGNVPEKAYCRTIIDHKCPNACFLNSPTPQATGRCWYPCDVSSLGYDICTRFGNRLNSMCSECDPEEIENARKNCVNYGCTAKQCNMEEDPEIVPDISCLNSCQKALGTTSRSTCATQKFYFTEGCDSCGPRALAYAKNLCLTQLKCSEEECGIGNEEIDHNTNYAPAPGPANSNNNGDDNSTSGNNGDDNGLGELPEDTPDVSCFISCLRGTNKYEDNCEKLNYIFESGCGSRCPAETLEWSRQECLNYVSDTGATCTNAQCGL